MDDMRPWTDEELKQLEDPDEWDWDNAVTVQPTARAGAVVAVRFSGDEFEEVAGHAQAAGKKLTDFIREAALAYIKQQGEPGHAARTGRKKKAPQG